MSVYMLFDRVGFSTLLINEIPELAASYFDRAISDDHVAPFGDLLRERAAMVDDDVNATYDEWLRRVEYHNTFRPDDARWIMLAMLDRSFEIYGRLLTPRGNLLTHETGYVGRALYAWDESLSLSRIGDRGGWVAMHAGVMAASERRNPGPTDRLWHYDWSRQATLAPGTAVPMRARRYPFHNAEVRINGQVFGTSDALDWTGPKE